MSGPGRYGVGQAPPVPAGMPPSLAAELPGHFTHTLGYKDWLAAHGLEFHTEAFDLEFDPIAASGGNLTAAVSPLATTVRVSQEADFVAEKLVESHTPAASTYSVRIFDNGTNRALSNGPILNASIAGTAQRPRIWKPRLFRRNSDIQIDFALVAGADITQLEFVMSGYKIFDKNALNLNNPQG